MQGQTLERQWRVLRALPAHPKSTTIPDLLRYLQDTTSTDAIKGLTVRTLFDLLAVKTEGFVRS